MAIKVMSEVESQFSSSSSFSWPRSVPAGRPRISSISKRNSLRGHWCVIASKIIAKLEQQLNCRLRISAGDGSTGLCAFPGGAGPYSWIHCLQISVTPAISQIQRAEQPLPYGAEPRQYLNL